MTPPDPPNPRRDETQARRGALAAGVVLILVAVMVLAGGGFVGRRTPLGASDSYTAFVRAQFIDKGRLIVRKDVDENAGVPIVDLDPAIYDGKDPAAWRYAVQSFLLDDIRRNDLSIWTIENGRVTDISPFAHQTPPPFAQPRAWSGSVLYREPAPAAAAQDIVLSPRGWAGPTLRLSSASAPIVTGDPRIAAVYLSAASSAAELTAAAFDIYCRPGDPAPVARVRRIGDQAGVWGGEPGSCAARTGAGDLTAGGFDALAPGDMLTLTTAKGAAASFERTSASQAERALSAATASGQRARDPAAGWWTVAVEHDYLRGLPEGLDGALRNDFRTSLDPLLQSAVQQKLDRFVERYPGPDDGQPKIAAVTVMDAMTGEVLAMASTPHDSLSARGVLDRDDARAKAARVNQNLQLLPIGSTAKPLLAAAILADNPALLSLTIPASTRTDDLLGLPLGTPLQTHAVGSTVTFDSFIQHSDNIYAASLLLLGSADAGSQRCRLREGESYADASGVHHDRPKSVFEALGPDGFCRRHPPENARQLRWADRLAALFDVNIFARGRQDPRYKSPNCMAGGRYGDDIHDVAPWRRLFPSRPGLRACAFKESSPFREALAIVSARDFRTDLLPVMLGNGEGRWSLVKLAEAYSRLITGRRVGASFIPVSRPDAGPLDPRFTARAALTHALTLVPSGTAAQTGVPKALAVVDQRLAGSNLVLGAFAKTGTPVALQARYTPGDRAINLLIEHGRIRLSPLGVLTVSTDLGSAPLAADTPREDRRRAARLLAADKVMGEARARFGVDAGAVIDRLVGYAGAMAKGEQPFVIERNALLVRVGARRDDGGDDDDDKMPHGKLLALVVAAYDTSAPDAPGRPAVKVEGRRAVDGSAVPVRAYTVVVSVQYPIKTVSNAAADLAGEIVADCLADRLAVGKGACR